MRETKHNSGVILSKLLKQTFMFFFIQIDLCIILSKGINCEISGRIKILIIEKQINFPCKDSIFFLQMRALS